MYRTFYGLREKPFSKTPDPRFLFMSSGHREALARLQYVIEEREIALLTGEIGCGKTTISRSLMDSMGGSCHFCFIFNPLLNSLEFLRSFARGLSPGEPPVEKDALLKLITDRLYDFYQRSQCPVLVIDEAQLVTDREIFEEIRLLTNFQMDDRNLMSLIIMGQPELRKIMSADVHEPFRQRLALNYHLSPLSIEETMDYLDFRMEVAGGEAGVFTPEAVHNIFQFSGGVPRKINVIATNALLEGFGREAAIIDGEIVESLKQELFI